LGEPTNPSNVFAGGKPGPIPRPHEGQSQARSKQQIRRACFRHDRLLGRHTRTRLAGLSHRLRSHSIPVTGRHRRASWNSWIPSSLISSHRNTNHPTVRIPLSEDGPHARCWCGFETTSCTAPVTRIKAYCSKTVSTSSPLAAKITCNLRISNSTSWPVLPYPYPPYPSAEVWDSGAYAIPPP
jgi:hypothetical protein